MLEKKFLLQSNKSVSSLNVMKQTTKRTVNAKALKKWLSANSPNGKEKLAAICGNVFGTSAVNKWINTGNAPKPLNRTRIVRATGIPLDTLFPEVPKRAS